MIGLSTTYYATQGMSIYDSVKRIRELGFAAVELGAAHSYEANPWRTLEGLKKDFPGILFTVHTLFPPMKRKVWFNPADGLNSINREIIDKLFASAKILEARYVSIHPAIFNDIALGDKVAGNFHKPVVGASKNKEKSQDNFMSLLEYASQVSQETTTALLIENLDNDFVNSYPFSVADFSEIFNQFPGTGMLLDIGHAPDSSFIKESVRLEGAIKEVHLHGGRMPKAGTQATKHSVISTQAFLDPLSGLTQDGDIIYIFEHGCDVSEAELIMEKQLLERFLSAQKP